MPIEDKIRVLGQLYEDFAKDTQTLYILFLDLANSTDYKQRLIEQGLPDGVWLHRQLIFLDICKQQMQRANGNLIKTIGDCVMVSYNYRESAEHIIYTCVELIKRIGSLRAFPDQHKMGVKISIDYGETINGSITGQYYDPVGICIDRCARLNKEANDDEIIYSNYFERQIKKQKTIKNIKDVHGSIQTVKKHIKDLRGLGKVTFYRVACGS